MSDGYAGRLDKWNEIYDTLYLFPGIKPSFPPASSTCFRSNLLYIPSWKILVFLPVSVSSDFTASKEGASIGCDYPAVENGHVSTISAVPYISKIYRSLAYGTREGNGCQAICSDYVRTSAGDWMLHQFAYGGRGYIDVVGFSSFLLFSCAC